MINKISDSRLTSQPRIINSQQERKILLCRICLPYSHDSGEITFLCNLPFFTVVEITVAYVCYRNVNVFLFFFVVFFVVFFVTDETTKRRLV